MKANKQRQDSVTEQLRDLIPIANQHGMYDAADFLKREVEKRLTPVHSEVAIYEAQKREDARADREGREPRLIARMSDITDGGQP